ncbi:MAG: outer membrane beta-barrel protein [Cytophagales bacterium]|nr:outer membrane beta-barrel protein [Cytophagales bacterium]
MILLCSALPFGVFAQDNETATSEMSRQQELGLTTSNFDSFGLTYRIGTQKSLWRFNTLLFSSNNSDYEYKDDNRETTANSFNTTLSIGKEYRKQINDKFDLRFGADLSFGYLYRKSNINDTDNSSEIIDKETLYTPGINFVLGANYSINKNIIVGAEILPGIYYTTGKEETIYSDEETESSNTVNISRLNYRLSNSSLRLSLAYRF